MADLQKKLELRVIAPAKATDKSTYKYNSLVDMVIMHLTTGDMGIMPGHVPVTGVLASGVLRIFNENQVKRVAIMGGVANVADDIITILSDSAEFAEDIDAASVTAKIMELQKQMENAPGIDTKNALRGKIARLKVLLDVAGDA